MKAKDATSEGEKVLLTAARLPKKHFKPHTSKVGIAKKWNRAVRALQSENLLIREDAQYCDHPISTFLSDMVGGVIKVERHLKDLKDCEDHWSQIGYSFNVLEFLVDHGLTKATSLEELKAQIEAESEGIII